MRLKISTDVVLGHAVLAKAQFSQLEASDRNSPRSKVQRCLAAINLLLISGGYQVDCDITYVKIGPLTDDVVEEVLEKLRVEGGWRARIQGRDDNNCVLIELI